MEESSDIIYKKVFIFSIAFSTNKEIKSFTLRETQPTHIFDMSKTKTNKLVSISNYYDLKCLFVLINHSATLSNLKPI